MQKDEEFFVLKIMQKGQKIGGSITEKTQKSCLGFFRLVTLAPGGANAEPRVQNKTGAPVGSHDASK